MQRYMLAKAPVMGFVTVKDMPEIIAMNPLQPMLMRCGMDRYLVPAILVEAAHEAIKAHGDYLRDVSFSSLHMEEARATQREIAKVQQREVAKLVHGVVGKVRISAPRVIGSSSGVSSGADEEWRGDHDGGL